MYEYYSKYDSSPLIDTNSRIDAVVETPLKLTLLEIAVCIVVFILIIGWFPGYSALLSVVITPCCGFLLYKYRKNFPKSTWSHFLWAIGYLDTKKIGWEVPNFFQKKRRKGLNGFMKSVFRKRRRYIVFRS